MFHGSIVALVTPMKSDGAIDQIAFTRLIEWHIESKTHAIVVGGTTGESSTLTFDEKHNLFHLAIKTAAGKIPIIAGTGTNCTYSTIELTKTAMKAGVDACLIVTPYYNKPTQEGLYQHYYAIAHAVPIPQILYNVPGRTSCDMQPEITKKLANIANIIGIKESGNIERVQEILNRCHKNFNVYTGEDILALDAIKIGAKGVISVTANVAPAKMSTMCDAALHKDFTTADKINASLIGLHKNLFVESNPIPVKWALNQMGLIEAGIRLPLTPLANQYHDIVMNAVKQAK